MSPVQLCAWCGKPVPIVEHIASECQGERLIWHWDCHDKDGAGTSRHRPWWARVEMIRSRGPNRVGVADYDARETRSEVEVEVRCSRCGCPARDHAVDDEARAECERCECDQYEAPE